MTKASPWIAADVVLGPGVRVHESVNLYGCRIGAHTRIGAFVEIQRDVVVGERCKISSHTFVCSGVRIANAVFIGHGVMFTNDRFPRATNLDGSLQGPGDWKCEETVVEEGASIGSNATILCGITIGAGALIGAGSVVTRDVAPGATVAGNPARAIRPRPPARGA
jgi:UDP-2-acetamido-3-amino-2,3-dideoxy-glucuronate N-acetyltransferase